MQRNARSGQYPPSWQGRRGLVAVAVLGMALLISSCSSSTNSSNGSKNSFEISTPAGQVSLSLDGKLPPNWPPKVPLPAKTTPAGSGSMVSESNGGVMVGVYKSESTPEEVYKFYVSEPSVTTESKAAAGSGSRFVGRLKISAPKEATITTVPSNGGALIVIAIKHDNGTGTSGRV
jgi:hypothetical protein